MYENELLPIQQKTILKKKLLSIIWKTKMSSKKNKKKSTKI